MTVRTKDMTTGNPAKLIISFTIPLMIGNIFQQLYTVVDTAIVGKALGVDALAALGAADWLNWLMLGLNQGLAQGFAILMAQQFGARRLTELRKTVGASALLAMLSSVFLLVAGQVFLVPVLNILRTPDRILDDTVLYLRIMFAGVPIVMAYNYLACVLRSMGDGRTPLAAMIVASMTNIVLDILFVLGFGWGIAGAAAATLVAQTVSALYCFRQLRKLQQIRLTASDFRLKRKTVWMLYKLGTPMAFQNLIIAVGGLIIQSVVNECGVTFIAGYTATNKLYGVLEVAALSCGYAMVTYVGQNMGAGKLQRIRKGVRSAILASLATSAVIAGVMILFGKWVLSAFISGSSEEFSATMHVAYSYLTLMSLFLPTLYVLHVFRSSIQGAGNTLLPMASGAAEFAVRTVAVFLLPGLIGLKGIYYAEVFAWVGADLILIPGYFFVIRRIRS